MLSTQSVQIFSAVTTSGSVPKFEAATATIPAIREASAWENTKYEIGGMITHYQQRLFVICDMHGRDLREVRVADGYSSTVDDGRKVMVSAIRCDLTRLLNEIYPKLNGSDITKEAFKEVMPIITGMIEARKKRLLMVSEMRLDNLVQILGDAGMSRARKWVTGYLSKNGNSLDESNVTKYIGRSVMREAIWSEMNSLNREMQKKLDQVK